MINDNPKPNKVDMHGIQRKGPGGDFNACAGLVFFLFIITFVVIACNLDKKIILIQLIAKQK
jgi:hypothetical protein